MLNRGTIAAAAMAVVAAMAPGSRAAEVELRAVTALPTNLPTVQIFKHHFVDKINQSNNGMVRVNLLGGPEVTPPRTALAAMQRGVVDLLRSPSSYYSGNVPEAFALVGSRRSAEEIRANGAWAALDQIWRKKAKAHLLAWADSETQLNLYLATKPPIGPNGPDLTGLKIRSSPTYRDLVQQLGGVPVSISIREVETALERGVVNGFGTASGSVLGMGVGKLVKYRVDPSFYRINVVLIASLASWNKLTRETQAYLDKAGRDYEQASIVESRKAEVAEAKTLASYGMQVLKLDDKAAGKFLDIAYDSMWGQLAKRAPDSAAKLRPLMYK